MRITTKAEFQWDDTTGSYVRTHEEGYDLLAGSPIALCKGASSSEQSLADSQASFANTLTQDYGTTFKNQQGILNNLTSTLTPIVQAGPGQYGFSAPEDAAMRTQANTGTAGAYQSAKQATGEALAAVGGGNMVLPNGASAQLNAQNANAYAQQQSNQQLGITQAGYQQGNANYNAAVGALGGTASMENPNGTAGQATGASGQAFGSANTIAQQNAAANPWNIGLGIAGGVGGAILGGPAGAAIGTKLGSAVGGAVTGSNTSGSAGDMSGLASGFGLG